MANGYSAGDLNLSIQATASDTIKYLDAIVERLSFIEKSMGVINKNPYIRKNASSNSNKNGFGFAKMGITIYSARRLGKFMADLVQAGSDYNETLNLWQVAMRDNLDVADQFINKMQKAYGISSKTLMNAQAIFKNMIGSLGQISDATAYSISEALVQMSADFSSLYNVQLESAFQKMQAMLAGQVRPIRSAGLDMTETTLYQFYQGMGGTKTMRQLNRTEKQLLSILAVYQQMGSAGALGDMTKTLNQFANQSRMMTQYWAELKTWSGLLLKDLIDQSGALVYINALLITTTEIFKAIAKSRGLGNENFIDGLFESAEATNDEIDELQGKLLDFDKFRSLEGAGTSQISIDQKLLDALSGYSSHIDQSQNKAQKLAEDWLKILGFTEGANGQLEISEENLQKIKTAIKTIGITLGAIIALKTTDKIISLVKSIFSLKNATTILNTAIISGVVYAIIKAVEAFKDGDYWTGIFASAIGVGLVGALLLLKRAVLIDGIPYLDLFGKTLNGNFLMVFAGISLLVGGISMFINNFDKLSQQAKIWIPVIASLAGVIASLAAGFTILKGNWAGAIGLGAMITGIGLMVGTQLAIPNYEKGASDIDSGTVFRAGEFGKTEAVYTGSNGKTNVANVRQMEQAFYNALARHSAEGNENIIVTAYLDGEKVYENTTSRAKARGNVWAKA